MQILEKYNGRIILISVLLFVILFSLSSLTVRPKLWFDEGLNIEIANNFRVYQKLDISTAPDEFSGMPYVVGTNGYTLTLPLSVIFDLFDIGLKQARLYMLVWLLLVISSFYYLIKNVFNKKIATAAIILTASFGSFYGQGLMATGELPGFFFLIWGLYFLLNKNKTNYTLTGALFALSAVSKPSIFLLLFPSFVLYLLFADRGQFFLKSIKFGLGALIPILIWIWLAFPEPFSLTTWVEASNFYLHPYGADYSAFSKILENVKLFFTHSTLIYFSTLFAMIVYWFLSDKNLDKNRKRFIIFFFIYSFFIILYFLRTPGWLRYVIGFELLTFAFVYPSLEFISRKLNPAWIRKYFASLVFLLLVGMQLLQLSYFRSDQISPYPELVSVYINAQLEKDSSYKVGIINSPDIASLINAQRRYHLIRVAPGMAPYGTNPLSFPKDTLPQFIAFRERTEYVDNYKNILIDNYVIISKLGDYSVYEKK